MPKEGKEGKERNCEAEEGRKQEIHLCNWLVSSAEW
jgi:hypothetical protein